MENATWNLLGLLLFEFQLNLTKSDWSLENCLFCGGTYPLLLETWSLILGLVPSTMVSEIAKYLRRVGDKRYPSLYSTSALQALLENVCSLGCLYKYKGFTETPTQHGCESRELFCNFHRTQSGRKSAVSGTGFPSSICRVAIGFGEWNRSVLNVELRLENCYQTPPVHWSSTHSLEYNF